jgi:hypothetical protein
MRQPSTVFVAFCGTMWYSVPGAAMRQAVVLPFSANEGGQLLLCPPITGEGGESMVTYSDLFQYTLVLIGLAGVIVAYLNNKKK